MSAHARPSTTPAFSRCCRRRWWNAGAARGPPGPGQQRLLLLSDDGDFIHRYTSPKQEVLKVYRVVCKASGQRRTDRRPAGRRSVARRTSPDRRTRLRASRRAGDRPEHRRRANTTRSNACSRPPAIGSKRCNARPSAAIRWRPGWRPGSGNFLEPADLLRLADSAPAAVTSA